MIYEYIILDREDEYPRDAKEFKPLIGMYYLPNERDEYVENLAEQAAEVEYLTGNFFDFMEEHWYPIDIEVFQDGESLGVAGITVDFEPSFSAKKWNKKENIW